MGSLASLISASRLSISAIARARSSAGACFGAMRRRYRCGMFIPRIRLHHGARPTYPYVRSIQATGDCERPLGVQNLNCLELLYAFVPFPYAVFAGLSAREGRLKGLSWRCSNTLDTHLRLISIPSFFMIVATTITPLIFTVKHSVLVEGHKVDDGIHVGQRISDTEIERQHRRQHSFFLHLVELVPGRTSRSLPRPTLSIAVRMLS
jgi:hypothetical protein